MGILKKLEDIYAAAAFAEAGEFDTAKEMVKDAEAVKKPGLKVKYDDVMLPETE